MDPYLLLQEATKKIEELESRWKRYKEADPKCNSIEYMISVEQANERLEVKVKELEKDLKKYFDSCRLREESLFAEVERREQLERQLASSNEIREAEKKILIQEIAKNKELENRIKELEAKKEDLEGEAFFNDLGD